MRATLVTVGESEMTTVTIERLVVRFFVKAQKQQLLC